MRIKIQTGDKEIETIGEEVKFDGFNHVFAVHANLQGIHDWPRFCVTHCDTGFRVAGGEFIDIAIENAHFVLSKLKPGDFERGVEKAEKIKEEIKQLKE